MRDADFREVASEATSRERGKRQVSSCTFARPMCTGDAAGNRAGHLRHRRRRLAKSPVPAPFLATEEPTRNPVPFLAISLPPRREQGWCAESNFPIDSPSSGTTTAAHYCAPESKSDMDYFQPSAPGQGAFVFDHRRRYRRRWRLRQCIQPSRPSNLLHVSAAIRCFRYYDVEEVQRAAAHFLGTKLCTRPRSVCGGDKSYRFQAVFWMTDRSSRRSAS